MVISVGERTIEDALVNPLDDPLFQKINSFAPHPSDTLIRPERFSWRGSGDQKVGPINFLALSRFPCTASLINEQFTDQLRKRGIEVGNIVGIAPNSYPFTEGLAEKLNCLYMDAESPINRVSQRSFRSFLEDGNQVARGFNPEHVALISPDFSDLTSLSQAYLALRRSGFSVDALLVVSAPSSVRVRSMFEANDCQVIQLTTHERVITSKVFTERFGEATRNDLMLRKRRERTEMYKSWSYQRPKQLSSS